MALLAHPYFDVIRELNLPKGEFAIFGSGPRIVRGLIEGSNDLDVLCRGEAWRVVRSKGRITFLEEYDITIATLCNDKISFGSQWGIGDPDVNMLIDAAEMSGDLPIVHLRHVIAYKRIRRSSRDMRHLEFLGKVVSAISSTQLTERTALKQSTRI